MIKVNISRKQTSFESTSKYEIIPHKKIKQNEIKLFSLKTYFEKIQLKNSSNMFKRGKFQIEYEVE